MIRGNGSVSRRSLVQIPEKGATIRGMPDIHQDDQAPSHAPRVNLGARVSKITVT